MSDRLARTAWFKAEILPHEPALRRHLRRAGLASAEIDDLVADAQTRAYASDRWQGVANGRAYIFMIARNLILDDVRRRKIVSFETFADFEALNLADEQPDAEAVVSSRDELRRLRAAIDALPEKTRYVFMRRRIDGIPADAVAKELRAGVSTIDKHLARALALLTQAMAEHDPISNSVSETAWRPGRQKR